VSTPQICALGPKGTNGHEAAMNFLNQSDPSERAIEFAPTHHDIFRRVAGQKGMRGIVPIETIRSGLVNEVIREFLRFNDQDKLPFTIAGECRMPIAHHLLVPRGVRHAEELSVVLSHGEALMQCSARLSELGLPTQPVSSTAHAAKQVAEQSMRGKAFGALASGFAGWSWGLETLEENLQGPEINRTRFYLLSHTPIRRTGNDKTTAIARIKNERGSLLRLLKPINDHESNMTTIQSIALDDGTYAFFLEFEGHQNDRNIRALLKDLRHPDLTDQLIVLGSFPRWEKNN
jgi:prephenate dehydratase